jgi:ABC-2 type transport system permease protein
VVAWYGASDERRLAVDRQLVKAKERDERRGGRRRIGWGRQRLTADLVHPGSRRWHGSLLVGVRRCVGEFIGDLGEQSRAASDIEQPVALFGIALDEGQERLDEVDPERVCQGHRVNGSALSSATLIPGFPTHDYRDFLIAMPFVQGAMFVSITAGVDLAKDIESGFLNRLAMTPVRGEALLGGALVLGVVQAIVYLLVGLAFGVTFVTGIGGAFVLLALSILIAFAFASIGVLLAVRFGTGEAVQGIFPLLFVTLFLSSSSLPRNLIKATWFRDVATYNPISYLLEGLRSVVIVGWDAQALALGFGFAAVILVIALGLAQASMKSRLTRT